MNGDGDFHASATGSGLPPPQQQHVPDRSLRAAKLGCPFHRSPTEPDGHLVRLTRRSVPEIPGLSVEWVLLRRRSEKELVASRGRLGLAGVSEPRRATVSDG